MPAKKLADFILICVLPGTTKERDSSVLHLYLIHAIFEEKEGLLYSTILFDNREPPNNQIIFLQLGPQLSRLQSFLTWSAAGGYDKWRHYWAFAFKELIKIPHLPESTMKFITLTLYNPLHWLLSWYGQTNQHKSVF